MGEQTISYDAQGNPTAYLGHTLTWEKGRQLKTFDNNAYTYNASGIRTSKTVNGITHIYTLEGNKIIREEWDGNTIVPLYDNDGNICGIENNSVPYYFQKNLQNDIVGILDKDAHLVAKYVYNVWGECIIELDNSGCNIASLNPYRFRGYYFDQETGMYYLQSRYYDPVTARFICADEVIFGTHMVDCIIASNLFAYAYNSPVINIDENGYLASAISSAIYYQMVAMSAAATSLMASIKAFVAMIWNIFIVVGLLLIAIAAIVYICKTIGNVYSTIEKIVSKQENYKKYPKNICVYVLARNEGDMNSIFYVGRTKNIMARHSQHKIEKGDFYMYVIYTCKSVIQSRVVEQSVLAGCLTGKFTNILFGTKPSNRIRGVAAKKAKSVIKKLGNEVKDTISLLGCTTESDLLFMMNR